MLGIVPESDLEFKKHETLAHTCYINTRYSQYEDLSGALCTIAYIYIYHSFPVK
jgi:hypothetical protein